MIRLVKVEFCSFLDKQLGDVRVHSYDRVVKGTHARVRVEGIEKFVELFGGSVLLNKINHDQNDVVEAVMHRQMKGSLSILIFPVDREVRLEELSHNLSVMLNYCQVKHIDLL